MFREQTSLVDRTSAGGRYRATFFLVISWLFAGLAFWASTRAIITGDTFTQRSPFAFWTDDHWHLHFKDHPVAFVGYVALGYCCGAYLFFVGWTKGWKGRP